MKAITFSTFGDPDVLQLTDLPDPEPGPGEVRVRIKAAGVQPVDCAVRSGWFAGKGGPFEEQFPQTLGNEFAGTVDHVGDGVKAFEAGDEVLGWQTLACYAEYVVVPADQIVHKPKNMPWEVAGGLSGAGQTAHTALGELGIGKGDTVLMWGNRMREAGYPEESVGRLMTPDYLAVKPEWTIFRALEHIRTRGHESETADVIYVVDDGWRLIDDMPLRRLVMADPNKTVRDVMDDAFVSLRATDDREEAVRKMQRYNRVALPVIDAEGVLLGIVTVDDVMDVAEEEATEDFHRVGGVMPLGMSYWQAGLWILYRSRIVWLAALVIVNLVSSGIIAAYEEALEALVALAFFIPLIIDTGGNAGAQSATMMIRGISTGDIRLDQWARVFVKEAGIGLIIGTTLGAMGFLLGFWRGGPEIGMQLGLIVLLTMIAMLVLTNLIGMILPFILTRLKLDPAVASGPLITSIADAVGLIVYFTIATAILGI
jgi:magnesium transporter